MSGLDWRLPGVVLAHLLLPLCLPAFLPRSCTVPTSFLLPAPANPQPTMLLLHHSTILTLSFSATEAHKGRPEGSCTVTQEGVLFSILRKVKTKGKKPAYVLTYILGNGESSKCLTAVLFSFSIICLSVPFLCLFPSSVCSRGYQTGGGGFAGTLPGGVYSWRCGLYHHRRHSPLA